MGKNNQRRRAAKKRRDGRAAQPAGHRARGWDLHHDPEWLLLCAGRAAGEGDAEGVEAVAERLARLPVAAVEAAATAGFADALGSAWEGGWQPAEAVRAVRRERAAQHADLVSTAMAVDRWRRAGTVPPAPWAAQLTDLAVDRWWGTGDAWLRLWARRAEVGWVAALQVAAEALGVLARLPVLEPVVPPPSRWTAAPATTTGPGAEALMAKIRALLAKAESTSFEAEAEALTAKAQQLMARHAVDEAVARADGQRSEVPVMRRIPVDDPYAGAKERLLTVVSQANGVRTVSHGPLGLVALVGFASDIDASEVLFTSLLVQASRGMLQRGRVTDARGRSRTRSYRQSFLLAFASRIHERLHAAASVAHHQAEAELGRSLLPVLADRDHEVDRAVAAHFPALRHRHGPRATNLEGWHHGRAAAEMATLAEEHDALVG